jgi:hypothetical protein
LHGADVDFDAGHLDAHRRGVLRFLVEVRRGDERLRGNASPVEADPADFVFFDARDLLL